MYNNSKAIKILIGGSPCTHWSIAQHKNRETTAEGEGWKLFKNYLIAKEKFQPDFFLYENNKSTAQPIKDQICEELGHPLQYINSALVSAQNRERFYVHNWECPQPEDRGIMLKDILESGYVDKEKSYYLKHQAGNARDYFKKHHTQIAFEPITVNEPERIGDIETNAQAHRVYSYLGKARTLIANAGGQGGKTGLYLIPIDESDKSKPVKVHEIKNGKIIILEKEYDINLPDGLYIIRKLTVTECCRLQTLPDNYCKAVSDTQAYKGLGNGWTAEIIIHQLKYALENIPRDTQLEVLSMYDGIGTGMYCLKQLGFTNITYKAYEIDKYAIRVATDNYPEIIECGNAFSVRNDDWRF